MKTLTDLKARHHQITDIWWLMRDPLVVAALDKVRASYKTEADSLKKEIDALQATAKAKEPSRWPLDTPEAVLNLVRGYWQGTEEHRTFRIHAWNSGYVWTSYPAGGYSTVGGWNPSTSGHYVLDRKRKEGNGPKVVKRMKGRQKPSEVKKFMDDLVISTFRL